MLVRLWSLLLLIRLSRLEERVPPTAIPLEGEMARQFGLAVMRACILVVFMTIQDPGNGVLPRTSVRN